MTQTGRQLYFLHVPKAGGTSLRNMLAASYDPEDVFPTRAMIDDEPAVYNTARAFRAAWEVSGRTDWSMVSSHVPFWEIRDLLAPDAIRLTVMREPLSRALSQIAHHQTNNAKWSSTSLDDIIANEPQLYRRKIGVGSYFGKNRKAARRALVDFDAVGLHTRFSTTTELFSQVTGLDLRSQHANRGDRGEGRADAVSLSSLYELQEALTFDSRLYVLACHRFREGVRAANVDD